MAAAHVNDAFFEHLRGFMANKHDLEEMWRHYDPRGASVLEAVTGFEVEGACRQEGGRTIDDVYANAQGVKEAFVAAMEAVGGELIVPSELKTRSRAEEKVLDDYATRQEPTCQWLCDVLRCSVVVETPREAVEVLEKLKENGDVTVLRVKNRFSPPLPNGYRDLLILVGVPLPGEGEASHVAEVQIHLKDLYAVKSNSHGHYKYFRNYFRGADHVAVESRLRLLQTVYKSPTETLQDVKSRCLAERDASRLSDLAGILMLLEEFQPAAEVLEALIDVSTKGSDGYFKAMQDLGDLYCLRLAGHYERAETIYKKIIEEKRPEIDLNTEESLANLLDVTGRHIEAEKVYVECLEMNRQHFGVGTRFATTMLNLAMCRMRLREFETAYENYQECHALFSEHGNVALANTALEGAATCLDYEERYAEALPIFEKIVATTEKTHGAESVELAKALQNLAVCQTCLNLHNEAEDTLIKSLAIKQAVFGTTHLSTSTCYAAFASLYKSKGQLEQAEEMRHRSIAIRREVLGREDVECSNCYMELGEMVRGEKGIDYVRKALAIREEEGTEANVLSALNTLAQLYQGIGDMKMLAETLSRTLPYPQDPLVKAQTHHNLGLLCMRNDDVPIAREHFQSALSLRRDNSPPDAPQIVHTLEQLGLLEEAEGNYPTALGYAREVATILEAALGAEHDLVVAKTEWAAGIEEKSKA